MAEPEPGDEENLPESDYSDLLLRTQSICSTPPSGVTWYRNTTVDQPWDATVGCVDWQQVQWEASFKDVPFAVESDSRTGGRRIQVHEYPSREHWDNEDLGRLRQGISVEGYVFGDKSDQWAEQLFAACTSPTSPSSSGTDNGAGILYLPMRVPLWAFCQSVESTFQASAMGRIDFAMTFSIETGLEAAHTTPSTQLTSTQLTNETYRAAQEVTKASREWFEEVFTGTQPSTARTTAAESIRTVGEAVKTAGRATRLTSAAGSVVEWVADRLYGNADMFADVQRSSTNSLSRQAAIQSQRTSGLSAQQAMQGVAIRASTGEILPALGTASEGFGGFLQNALGAMVIGTNSPSDLAQALLPMTMMKPRVLRALSAYQMNTASVQAELQLAEVICSLTRRMALAQSIVAAVKVAPSKQPDASLTRTRLLQQIDEEIAILPSNSRVQDSMRRLRNSVVRFVGHYSQYGGSTVAIPNAWSGQPLAAVAASVYGKNATGRDSDLMKFNGIKHPMFTPAEIVAMKDPLMLYSGD